MPTLRFPGKLAAIAFTTALAAAPAFAQTKWDLAAAYPEHLAQR